MDEQTFIDLLYKSMDESARQVRLTTGRPTSKATREEAIRQVEMLNAAKNSFDCIEKAEGIDIDDKKKEL